MTWHSSEMMPGGTPHLQGATAVDALLARIEDFLAWLHNRRQVVGMTLDDLRGYDGITEAPPANAGADWRYDANPPAKDSP